jgi:hypothetical protein
VSSSLINPTAENIEWIMIGDKILSKECLGLITSLHTVKDVLKLDTYTDRTKDINATPDKLLGVLHKVLKDPVDVKVAYKVIERELWNNETKRIKETPKTRVFLYKNCKFDNFKDEEGSHYIYNRRTINLKFEPVNFKTEPHDKNEYITI